MIGTANVYFFPTPYCGTVGTYTAADHLKPYDCTVLRYHDPEPAYAGGVPTGDYVDIEQLRRQLPPIAFLPM